MNDFSCDIVLHVPTSFTMSFCSGLGLVYFKETTNFLFDPYTINY